MTAYTITPEQRAAIVTAQKQLIDLRDEKTAATLAWALTAEPATVEEATQALEALKKEQELLTSIIDGYPDGYAKRDAARALRVMKASIAALSSAAPSAAEPVGYTWLESDGTRCFTKDKAMADALTASGLREAQPVYLAAPPAPQPTEARPSLLAADHTSMRVDYSGLLKQARAALRSSPGLAEMLRQLQEHLHELGQRWYAGDTAVVDEILQLYCIEHEARAALKAKESA